MTCIIYYLCRPYNLLRKAMVAALVVGFCVCVLVLPELFTISALDLPAGMILAVFALLSWPALMLFCRAQEKLQQSFASLRSPGRHARPKRAK